MTFTVDDATRMMVLHGLESAVITEVWMIGLAVAAYVVFFSGLGATSELSLQISKKGVYLSECNLAFAQASCLPKCAVAPDPTECLYPGTYNAVGDGAVTELAVPMASSKDGAAELSAVPLPASAVSVTAPLVVLPPTPSTLASPEAKAPELDTLTPSTSADSTAGAGIAIESFQEELANAVRLVACGELDVAEAVSQLRGVTLPEGSGYRPFSGLMRSMLAYNGVERQRLKELLPSLIDAGMMTYPGVLA
jgi:hypothetical protein